MIMCREEAEDLLREPRPGRTSRPFLQAMKGKAKMDSSKKRPSDESSEQVKKRKSTSGT